MFTVWGPIKQPCIIVLGLFCFICCEISEPKESWDTFCTPFHARPHTHVLHRCDCPCALWHVCMCGSKKWQKDRLILWKSTLFFCFSCCDFCHEHFLSTLWPLSGFVWMYGGACSANSYMHCYICPKSSSKFVPFLPFHHHNQEKGQTIPTKRKQSFPVWIRGCREGSGSAWVGIGIYTGFYCHLKIHFCHCGILYCMLRLEF